MNFENSESAFYYNGLLKSSNLPAIPSAGGRAALYT
jgi:hypothetical protein